MNWKNPNSYGFASVVAIALHLLVAGLFLLEWPDSHPQLAEPVPKHVMATVVQEENKAVKQRQQQAERDKQRKAREAKRRAEKERQRKLEAKRKKEQARQEKLKRERLAKQKADAEKKRQAEAEREKQQRQEQQRQEQQRQEQQRQQREKEQQQAEQRRLEQIAQEQAMLEQLAQERAAAELAARQEAEARAERAAALQSEYTALIRDQITSVWRYPPAVDANMEVTLRLGLVPTGEVVQVQIIRSSGNQALDRSVEQAIYKASPLPVPSDIAVFEQNFRNFTMKFRPENASW